MVRQYWLVSSRLGWCMILPLQVALTSLYAAVPILLRVVQHCAFAGKLFQFTLYHPTEVAGLESSSTYKLWFCLLLHHLDVFGLLLCSMIDVQGPTRGSFQIRLLKESVFVCSLWLKHKFDFVTLKLVLEQIWLKQNLTKFDGKAMSLQYSLTFFLCRRHFVSVSYIHPLSHPHWTSVPQPS